MSDYKSAYSDISKDYIENIVASSSLEQERYNRSKAREARNNINWIKQKVNLNEIVDRFIPENSDVVTQHTEGGVKYDFEGSRYIVKCDKVSGYLRIYDKNTKSYCLPDGTLSRDLEKTHFKIKHRGGDVSMWIRVAMDKNALYYGSSLEYTYVDGENTKEFYFDDETAKELETDGFFLKCGLSWMRCSTGETAISFLLKNV